MADSLDAKADEAADRRIGRYELRGEIDRGGVGVVYRAWQADLKREVALKMLLPERLETRDALNRFRREAELMASLDHPGILPVYEVGEQDGVPYYSMKLAEGGNLAARVPSLRGRFRECARLVAALARAVGYAHGRGVLHRDLKPSNVVFDAAGECLVTDFGLARRVAVDSSLTGIDALIGTPRYVAPEAISPGALLTAAADVYGLGAILYELLTGSAPFAELTPVQILQQVATRRPRQPRQFDDSIPPELEAICLRCLEKRAGDRFASANALADALETWLAGAGQRRLLTPPHWLRLALPSRRRAFGVGAAVLLLSTLAGAAAWLGLREPIPFPDPVIGTSTLAVLPAEAQVSVPAVRDAARQLAAYLQLPSTLHLLPFEAALEVASSKDFPRNDVDALDRLGGFVFVDVVALAGTQKFAVRAGDFLRDEALYEADFASSELEKTARDLSAALTRKRGSPVAEARLPRAALASILRAIRWLEAPAEGTNELAVAALKDAIEKAPDSAVAHAWLGFAYNTRGGEAYWLDSAIDEAARAQRMDPTLSLAEKQLGFAYFRKNWFARATTAYERARAMGNLSVDNELALAYYATGRFADSYRSCRNGWKFATDTPFPQVVATHVLFAVGENDAGERGMRALIATQSDGDLRTLQEAEIASYRGDAARCRQLARRIDPETTDGYFTASGLLRTCAAREGDYPAALATLDATKRAYANGRGYANSDDPALSEAILRVQLNRSEDVAAMLSQARQGLQAAIDASSESPKVWLRMAAAQRLGGEVDAAYASLERAFASGLTVNNRNRWDLEFLPFAADARFETLRARSEAEVAAQRKLVAAQLVLAVPASSANDPRETQRIGGPGTWEVPPPAPQSRQDVLRFSEQWKPDRP